MTVGFVIVKHSAGTQANSNRKQGRQASDPLWGGQDVRVRGGESEPIQGLLWDSTLLCVVEGTILVSGCWVDSVDESHSKSLAYTSKSGV